MSVSHTITNRNKIAANPKLASRRSSTGATKSPAAYTRPAAHHMRRMFEASAATPKAAERDEGNRDARPVEHDQKARARQRHRADRQHGVALIRADQRLPLPQHGERGDGPEREEDEPAEIGRGDGKRRQHQRRHDAQHQIAAAGHGRQPGWLLVGRLDAGHG